MVGKIEMKKREIKDRQDLSSLVEWSDYSEAPKALTRQIKTRRHA